MDQTDVDYMVNLLEQHVRNGRSIEESVAEILRNPWGAPPRSVIDAAVDIYHHKAQLSMSYGTAESIQEYEIQTGAWYTGPDFDTARYWPHVRNQIEEKIGDAVDQVDKASTQVMASLRPPFTEEFDTRGLVLGYVQSGKTTNFLSVIAKAADVGYRLIIVLTGITESLRSQTQKRIEEQLVSGTTGWHKLTNENADFTGRQETTGENAQTILSNPHSRVLAVSKKNVTVLKKLNDFIIQAGNEVNSQCPILIIDDEADQASISVSKDPDTDPSAINSQIRQLLRHQKTAYIAYTATPFANILVNPNNFEDIYPRDFIHVLPKPEGYFGTEDLFGREPHFGEDTEENTERDMIRLIPDDESDALRPPRKRKGAETVWDPYIPQSLTDAIRWFILATAARRARGQNSHSSMLIHTAMLRDAHTATAELLDPLVKNLKKDFAAGTSLSTWKELWDFEASLVSASEFGNPDQKFEEVAKYLQRVFDELTIAVDHHQSSSRLSYDSEEPLTVIAIGGNTLSRGLTLEGLVCSYFVRNATVYDTLLQMGRWFGFRHGYEDLPRIWLTEELTTWFHELSKVELDLRQDFSRYAREGLTPLEFQARIRVTPGLEVTNRAKQRNIKSATVSFSGQKVQTILFKHKDLDWLSHNIEATRRLVTDLNLRQLPTRENSNGTLVYRRVPTDSILTFLKDYHIHESSSLGALGASSLIKYIENEVASKSIREWSISFYGKRAGGTDNEIPTVDLGLGRPLTLISRSRMATSREDTANIKTLVGSLDRLNDAGLSADQLSRITAKVDGDPRSREQIILDAHATYLGSDVGHLAIYAIDKDSKTSQPSDYKKPDGTSITPINRRKHLEAVEHMIGIGIYFPESIRLDGSVEYVSAIEPDAETLARYHDAEDEVERFRAQANKAGI